MKFTASALTSIKGIFKLGGDGEGKPWSHWRLGAAPFTGSAASLNLWRCFLVSHHFCSLMLWPSTLVQWNCLPETKDNRNVWSINPQSPFYHEPIIVVTLAVIALVGLAVVVAVTKAGKWQYLWNEWFTSVDHKKLASCTRTLLQWSCWFVVCRCGNDA